MIDKLLEFIKTAGKTQLNVLKQNHLDIRYKNEQTVSMVTVADIKVSAMFKDFMVKNFSDIDYFIVDEESYSQYGDDIFAKIKASEYVFILDPLDGTIHYSQNIPLFGISLGVFKKGKPYAGVIYTPALGEMVYRDEKGKVFYCKNTFSAKQQKQKLSKNMLQNSRLVIDLQHHFSLDLSKNNKDYLFVDYLCSVFCYILLATGRVRSGMFRDWLWDAAGAWTIFSALGIKIYDWRDDKFLEKLDKKDFTKDLKFKHAHIIGKQEEIDYLNTIIVKDLQLK